VLEPGIAVDRLFAPHVPALRAVVAGPVLHLVQRVGEQPGAELGFAAVLERTEVGQRFATRRLHEVGNRLPGAQRFAGAHPDIGHQLWHVLADQLSDRGGITPAGAGDDHCG
jgi:hypothetical protein